MKFKIKNDENKVCNNCKYNAIAQGVAYCCCSSPSWSVQNGIFLCKNFEVKRGTVDEKEKL